MPRASCSCTKGFAATTTGEIAELADVAKGTLFFHAKSKEALLVMMFQEEVGAAIRRAFSNVPDAPFIEQLMHVFGIMLRQNQRDLGLARIFVKEMAFVRGDRHGVDVVMDDLFARLGDLIERAKDRREVARTVDSAVFAYNLFALYFAFLVLWLGSGAPSPQRQHPSLREIIGLQLGVVSASVAKPRSTGKRQK